MDGNWPWLALIGLGAYHGINPGMGWLFAVSLGLQERSRAAVLRAFAPIVLGHALSITVVVFLVAAAQSVVTPAFLKWTGGGLLILFGVYKVVAPMSHPRWATMKVNFRLLTLWSFLMATAHGAGLMLVPVLLKMPASDHAHHGHAEHMPAESTLSPIQGLAAVTVHTAAMFIVMALVALIVYEKLGVAILRRAWFNLDKLWAFALILAGVIALVM